MRYPKWFTSLAELAASRNALGHPVVMSVRERNDILSFVERLRVLRRDKRRLPGRSVVRLLRDWKAHSGVCDCRSFPVFDQEDVVALADLLRPWVERAYGSVCMTGR